MDAKKPKIPAAVRRASQWTLVNASFHVLSFAFRPAVAYALAHHDAACSECVSVPGAQSALWLGMRWCAALQAAAAALALLLPCRRRGRALAHLALAVTIAGHYMYAVAVRLLLAADPGFVFGRIVGPATIVFFAGGDLVCFGLLQLSWEVRTE